MLPVIIIACVAIPVLVIAFMASRADHRGGRAARHGGRRDEARNEQEFADAEAYQEQWREEEHKHHPPDSLY